MKFVKGKWSKRLPVDLASRLSDLIRDPRLPALASETAQSLRETALFLGP